MRWGLGEGKGEKDGSGRVTAIGIAGLGSRFGPGEGAHETFWDVSKPWGSWGSALLPGLRATGPAVGPPRAVRYLLC